MENETEKKKTWFPKVGTTEAQKEFVNDLLLPKMKDAGLIESANVSDLVRWAIESGANTVGVKIDTPMVEKKKPGRKSKGG
jgi:hypothetical protein